MALGNPKKDGLVDITSRYAQDAILPLRLNRPGILSDPVRRFSDPRLRRMVDDIKDDGMLVRRKELYRPAQRQAASRLRQETHL